MINLKHYYDHSNKMQFCLFSTTFSDVHSNKININFLIHLEIYKCTPSIILLIMLIYNSQWLQLVTMGFSKNTYVNFIDVSIHVWCISKPLANLPLQQNCNRGAREVPATTPSPNRQNKSWKRKIQKKLVNHWPRDIKLLETARPAQSVI